MENALFQNMSPSSALVLKNRLIWYKMKMLSMNNAFPKKQIIAQPDLNVHGRQRQDLGPLLAAQFLSHDACRKDVSLL
jgi:hypothetical protein